MKVKCRDYIGYLEEIEVTTKYFTGEPKFYRVQLQKKGDFIDLRNVKLGEIEFVKEESDA